MNLFFGENCSTAQSASKIEVDTFLHLLETREELALDYLNCWFFLRNIEKLPEQSLRVMPFFVNMKTQRKKKRRKS